MLQIDSKRECTINLDGDEVTLPVRPRTTTTSIILSELYDERKRIISDLMDIQKKIVPFQTKIETMQGDSRDFDSLSDSERKQIEKDLKETEKLQSEMVKVNKNLDEVLQKFFRAIIIDFDKHADIVSLVPLENTWDFIQELIQAMSTPVKKKVMNSSEQDGKLIELNGKSDSENPVLLKAS